MVNWSCAVFGPPCIMTSYINSATKFWSCPVVWFVRYARGRHTDSWSQHGAPLPGRSNQLQLLPCAAPSPCWVKPNSHHPRDATRRDSLVASGGTGADFHIGAMVATAPRENPFTGRRPVRNWTRRTISSLFYAENYICSQKNQQKLLPPELHFLTPNRLSAGASFVLRVCDEVWYAISDRQVWCQLT